jgi:predicted MPP superfamily phosphohydrolase
MGPKCYYTVDSALPTELTGAGVARLTRRTFLQALVTAGVGASGGVGAYGYLYARRALETTRADVPVAGLPAGLTGLRVGFLSDVHRSRWVSADDVADGVERLMAERPDLIVLGGDYVTRGDRRYVTPAAEALAPLSAPYGVFAILGNHDDDRDMPRALARRGIHVLKDARTRLQIRGEALELAGIRYWTQRPSHIASVLRGAVGPTVLLAHDPRRLVEADALNVSLVLSGHTHGGQVVLPVVGAVAAQKFPVVAGLARRNRTSIFVSRGLGTVYVPIRINCPPEVALLRLQPA